MADTWALGNYTFTSRLLVGTGKYPDFPMMQKALTASGAEVVTVAVRRLDLSKKGSESLLEWIPKGMSGEGHLLVFNNGGGRKPVEYSSVDEFVPPTDKDGHYIRPGASTIFREQGNRLIAVKFSVRDRDLAGAVAEAQERTKSLFTPPYRAEWSGEFQEMEEAEKRLLVTVSLALGLIVGYERSYHGRAAGMRTYGLVCMASAAITVIRLTWPG